MNLREIQIVKEQSRPVPVVGLVATGALLVGAGVTGGLALTSSQKYDSLMKQVPLTAGELESARKRTRTFSAVADGCAAAAVLVGAYTIYHWASWKPTAPEMPKTLPTVEPVAHGAMVGLRGSF